MAEKDDVAEPEDEPPTFAEAQEMPSKPRPDDSSAAGSDAGGDGGAGAKKKKRGKKRSGAPPKPKKGGGCCSKPPEQMVFDAEPEPEAAEADGAAEPDAKGEWVDGGKIVEEQQKARQAVRAAHHSRVYLPLPQGETLSTVAQHLNCRRSLVAQPPRVDSSLAGS